MLVLALLITPAATASLLANRLTSVLVVSVVVGVLSAVIGFYASYYLDVASGASIVLVLSVLFLFAYVGSRVRHRRVA